MEQENRLLHLETIIARNQGHFCDIGRALNEIRKNRLYKLALFETFESYTRAWWDMGRAYAYRLIKSYEVVCNLSPIGDILPANECQVRPLAQLEPIEQRKAWQRFLNSGMEITALNIKKFIRTRTMDNLKVTPNLSIDDRFYLLLHKKIMNKTGSAKRRAKKYYKDQYKKTGIIPAPLFLAEKGIMEGRKCSGRPRSIDEQTKRRFIEIVKASCDPSSQGFIFITRKARAIKNYHHWLEQELGRSISLTALRRCARRENLKFFLCPSAF